MPDYLVTFTVSFAVTAKDQNQAEERAQQMEAELRVELPMKTRWLGDMEGVETAVEEQ